MNCNTRTFSQDGHETEYQPNMGLKYISQYARTTTVTFDEMTRTLSLSIFFKRMAA